MSESLLFGSFPLCWWVMYVRNWLTIAHFLWAIWANCSFCSNQMSDVRESLRSFTKSERPWAICSHRSFDSSEMSDSLTSLRENEGMSESLIFLSKLLIRSSLGKKRVISSEIKWANSQPCVNQLQNKKGWEWEGFCFNVNLFFKYILCYFFFFLPTLAMRALQRTLPACCADSKSV